MTAGGSNHMSRPIMTCGTAARAEAASSDSNGLFHPPLPSFFLPWKLPTFILPLFLPPSFLSSLSYII